MFGRMLAIPLVSGFVKGIFLRLGIVTGFLVGSGDMGMPDVGVLDTLVTLCFGEGISREVREVLETDLVNTVLGGVVFIEGAISGGVIGDPPIGESAGLFIDVA